MGRGTSSLLFRTLIVLAFILVISIGILQSEGNQTKTTTAIASDDRRSRTSTATVETLRQQEEHAKVLGIGKSSVADPNYMSKRRVPNGPDPIHNRRAGNSGRPPGRA